MRHIVIWFLLTLLVTVLANAKEDGSLCAAVIKGEDVVTSQPSVAVNDSSEALLNRLENFVLFYDRLREIAPFHYEVESLADSRGSKRLATTAANRLSIEEIKDAIRSGDTEAF